MLLTVLNTLEYAPNALALISRYPLLVNVEILKKIALLVICVFSRISPTPITFSVVDGLVVVSVARLLVVFNTPLLSVEALE